MTPYTYIGLTDIYRRKFLNIKPEDEYKCKDPDCYFCAKQVVPTLRKTTLRPILASVHGNLYRARWTKEHKQLLIDNITVPSLVLMQMFKGRTEQGIHVMKSILRIRNGIQAPVRKRNREGFCAT